MSWLRRIIWRRINHQPLILYRAEEVNSGRRKPSKRHLAAPVVNSLFKINVYIDPFEKLLEPCIRAHRRLESESNTEMEETDT